MIAARTASWVAVALVLSAAAAWAFAAFGGSATSAIEFALPLVLGLVVLVLAIDAVASRGGVGLCATALIVYAATLGMSVECVVVATGSASSIPGFLTAAVTFGAIAVAGASRIRGMGAGPWLVGCALLGFGIGWGVTAAIGANVAGSVAVMAIAALGSMGLVVRYRRRPMPPARPGSATGDPAEHEPDGVAAALALYLGVVEVIMDLVRSVDRFMGGTREDPAWHARHGVPTDRRVHPR